MDSNKRKRVDAGATAIHLDDVTCQICHRDASDPFSANCDHSFCRKCIVNHFQRLLEPDEIRSLHCPVPGCSEEATYFDLRALLPKELIDVYMNKLLATLSFLKGKQTVRVCTNCGSGVVPVDEIPDMSHKEVQAALQVRDLKRTRSKKDGVNSLMNYVSERSLFSTCTGCNVEPESPLKDFGAACIFYGQMLSLEKAWEKERTWDAKTPRQTQGSGSSAPYTVWANGTGYGGGELDSKALKDASSSSVKALKAARKAVSSIAGTLENRSGFGISLYAVLNNGILNRVLEQMLSSSLLDVYMLKAEACYLEVFRLLTAISAYPDARSIVSPGQSTVVTKLEELLKQAEVARMAEDGNRLVDQVRLCYDKLCRRRQKAVVEEDILEISVEQMYKEKLRKLQFRMIDSLHFIHYFRHLPQNQATDHRRMLRIQKELGVLSTSLPLEWQSSIHICVNENNMTLLKALIIGPHNTPYQNGVFLFDIFLPEAYPNAPPRVQFLTTGGGRVAFNPNLYSSGKVCLSLLGTWQGPSWVPGISTILQVLVSIQSLIFVKDPFFNEPGHEMHGNILAAERANIQYRQNTLSVAILPALMEPDPAFRDVILEHFRIKKHEIEQQCDSWLESTDPDTRPSMAATVQAIKAVLLKL